MEQLKQASELIYLIALNKVLNYKPLILNELLEHFHTPEQTYLYLSREHLNNQLVKTIGYNNISILKNPGTLHEAEREAEWADRENIRLISITDPDYPYRLKECPDAPALLYYKGTADLNKLRVVSIVGTRSATHYGREQCTEVVRLLSEFKESPLIISGLAYGIDITAHLKAVEYNLETVAVMATGIDIVYPSLHRRYIGNIIKQGGILTEFPRGTTPHKINFVQRNRIIAGLSDATILIESPEKGGGVITSKMAASYSRDVYAVPGRISDIYSLGCNNLIEDKIASLFCSERSLKNGSGWDDFKENSIAGSQCNINFEPDNETTDIILRTLREYGPQEIDSLIRKTGYPVPDLLKGLLKLELENRVCNRNNIYELH